MSARDSGLLTLTEEHLSVPTDKGSHRGDKIGSLVAGMVAGTDSIADMARDGCWSTSTIRSSKYPATVNRDPDTATPGSAD